MLQQKCDAKLHIYFGTHNFSGKNVILAANAFDTLHNVFEVEKNIFEVEKNVFEVKKNIFEVEKNVFEVKKNVFEVKKNIFERVLTRAATTFFA